MDFLGVGLEDFSGDVSDFFGDTLVNFLGDVLGVDSADFSGDGCNFLWDTLVNFLGDFFGVDPADFLGVFGAFLEIFKNEWDS